MRPLQRNDRESGLKVLGKLAVTPHRYLGDRIMRLTLNSYRQVQIMSTLPLKAMSRLWGRFNELTIPYYLRVPGFKLYSYIFGVK